MSPLGCSRPAGVVRFISAETAERDSLIPGRRPFILRSDGVLRESERGRHPPCRRVDPARPAAGQLSPEPLGLSRSVEWIPNGRFGEPEHAGRRPAVGSSPVFEVLEAMTVENDLASHRSSIHV